MSLGSSYSPVPPVLTSSCLPFMTLSRQSHSSFFLRCFLLPDSTPQTVSAFRLTVSSDVYPIGVSIPPINSEPDTLTPQRQTSDLSGRLQLQIRNPFRRLLRQTQDPLIFPQTCDPLGPFPLRPDALSNQTPSGALSWMHDSSPSLLHPTTSPPPRCALRLYLQPSGRTDPRLLNEGVGHWRREKGGLAGHHGWPQPRVPDA